MPVCSRYDSDPPERVAQANPEFSGAVCQTKASWSAMKEWLVLTKLHHLSIYLNHSNFRCSSLSITPIAAKFPLHIYIHLWQQTRANVHHQRMCNKRLLAERWELLLNLVDQLWTLLHFHCFILKLVNVSLQWRSHVPKPNSVKINSAVYRIPKCGINWHQLLHPAIRKN